MWLEAVQHCVGWGELGRRARKLVRPSADLPPPHSSAEDLCNCEFSLAYGAKILLNNARLRLKRGKRYGLCGPNGSGKTTLMRAIVNGQVGAGAKSDRCITPMHVAAHQCGFCE